MRARARMQIGLAVEEAALISRPAPHLLVNDAKWPPAPLCSSSIGGSGGASARRAVDSACPPPKLERRLELRCASGRRSRTEPPLVRSRAGTNLSRSVRHLAAPLLIRPTSGEAKNVEGALIATQLAWRPGAESQVAASEMETSSNLSAGRRAPALADSRLCARRVAFVSQQASPLRARTRPGCNLSRLITRALGRELGGPARNMTSRARPDSSCARSEPAGRLANEDESRSLEPE